MPRTAQTASPAAGSTAVARNVTSTGPTTKVSSSTTASMAKAVSSSGESRSRWLQRAPDRAAGRGEAQPGHQRARDRGGQRPAALDGHDDERDAQGVAERRARPAPGPGPRGPSPGPTAGRRPRRRPSRRRRPRPARPNDPLVSETSRTMPIPVIDCGSRATNPVALNRRAGGSPSTARVRREPRSSMHSPDPLPTRPARHLRGQDRQPAPWQDRQRARPCRPGGHRPVRRPAPRLVRRAREARRRDALPRERHPRPRHPARAAGRRRAPLRRLRRAQPDQRPVPRAARRAARPSSTPAGSTSRSTGATATGTPSSARRSTGSRPTGTAASSPC